MNETERLINSEKNLDAELGRQSMQESVSRSADALEKRLIYLRRVANKLAYIGFSIAVMVTAFSILSPEVVVRLTGNPGFQIGSSLALVFVILVVITNTDGSVRESMDFIDVDIQAESKKRRSVVGGENVADLEVGDFASLEVTERPVDISSHFESYITRLIGYLDSQIEQADRKASILLDTAKLYIRRGIYFYVVSIAFWQALWLWVGGVSSLMIVGIVSCSLTFLVIEFLAAWFLRQYKGYTESALMYAKIKTIFHRYMLANIAIKEFSTKETWAESRVHMLKVLEEQIKWPDALDNKSDMNHMVEMFNSFSLAAEKMKNTFGKQNAE